jgi:hypothetical protein
LQNNNNNNKKKNRKKKRTASGLRRHSTDKKTNNKQEEGRERERETDTERQRQKEREREREDMENAWLIFGKPIYPEIWAVREGWVLHTAMGSPDVYQLRRLSRWAAWGPGQSAEQKRREK